MPEHGLTDLIQKGQVTGRKYSLSEATELLEDIVNKNKQTKELEFGNQAHSHLFYEMLPLIKLGKFLFPNYEQVQVEFSGPAGDPFDGIIYHEDNKEGQKIEFVHAVDGHNEGLRYEYLKEYGAVKGSGKMKSSGTKHNRIWGDNKFGIATQICSDKMNEDYEPIFEQALRNKISANSKNGKYIGTWLGIVFSDLFFIALDENPELIIPTIEKLTKKYKKELSTIFQRVFFIGTSKDFLYEARIN